MDQGGHDLARLLSDPAFVERTVASDAFIDWNLKLAIDGVQLSKVQGANLFLQTYPHYIVELRHIHTPLGQPNLPLPPNLLDLWQSFLNSDWLQNNEHEPKINGFSVLRQMLVQQSDSTDTQTLWTCCVPSPSQPSTICGRYFRRWDRAVTHIRAIHLDHRPFPCGGQCGVPTCERRFTSQENLRQHYNHLIENREE